MHEQKYEEAKIALLNFDAKDSFVRKFLCECIVQSEDFELALKVLADPQTEEESIILLNAAIQKGAKPKMKEVAEVVSGLFPSSPSTKELIKKIEVITK